MSGREVATKILTTEQPELPREAQAQLERDKLFFLEHRRRLTILRPMVEGEALPYRPHESAMVTVYRGRREFFVFGKQTLVIEEPQETKEIKREHNIIDFPKLQLERAAARREKETVETPVVPPIDITRVRREAEHARQAVRRLEKQQKRNAIKNIKAANKIIKLAERRQQREQPEQVTE